MDEPTKKVLEVLYRLECDPTRAGERHLTGWLELQAEIAPYQAIKAVEELERMGVIARDHDFLERPSYRVMWRTDRERARVALQGLPSLGQAQAALLGPLVTQSTQP